MSKASHNTLLYKMLIDTTIRKTQGAVMVSYKWNEP